MGDLTDTLVAEHWRVLGVIAILTFPADHGDLVLGEQQGENASIGVAPHDLDGHHLLDHHAHRGCCCSEGCCLIPWYLIHVAGLGIIGTSILVWTWHFADALTRRKQSQHKQLARLIGLCVGTLALAVALATLAAWVWFSERWATYSLLLHCCGIPTTSVRR